MLELVWDAVLDAVKMLPFLFGAYALMEWMEHRAADKMQRALQRMRRFGPVGGALLGCFPQCGFSVAAANLYAGRMITAGTMLAVFLSTSDEALPVLLAHPGSLPAIAGVVGVKIVVAALFGFLYDAILQPGQLVHSDENHLHAHCHDAGGAWSIVWAAVRHTLSTFAFVLIVMVAFNLAIGYVGEDALQRVLLSGRAWQPVLAGLIGLIPNCAPSVLLTELYLAGSLSFGSLIAGLCAGAGMGLVVLLRNNHSARQNLRIIGYLYAVSVLCGLVLQWIA